MDGKRSRGRAGFLKGKLTWSLYRASATHKVKPNKPTADEEHLRSSRPHQSYNNNIPAHQLTHLPTQTRSVSYYHPTTTDDSYLYGGIAVDDEIDRKAANYISSVRERFSLA